MNKRLIHSSIVALIVVVALTSCNRQHVPEFASGRFHHKEKVNKQADESTIALQQRDKIEPISSKAPEELQVPSVNEKVKPIAGKSNRMATRPTHKKANAVAVANETSLTAPFPNNFAGVLNKPSATQFKPHDGDRLLCAIIAIFIPFLGVGIFEGITVNFWIDLILTLLFYFPGLIFALIVILSD